MAVAVASELWANRVSRRMPKATITGLRLARRLMHFDPSRSLAELALLPRGLEVSLREMVEWLRAEGLLADRGRLRRGTAG
jgi:dihydroflavonol-4-reductase